MTTVYLPNGGNTSSTSPPGLTASGDVTVGGTGQTVVVDSGNIDLSGGQDTFSGSLQVNSTAQVTVNSTSITSQGLVNFTNNGSVNLLSGSYTPAGSGGLQFNPAAMDISWGDGTGDFYNNGNFELSGQIGGGNHANGWGPPNFEFNGIHNTGSLNVSLYLLGASAVFQTGAGGFTNSTGGVISFTLSDSPIGFSAVDLRNTVSAPFENDGSLNIQGVAVGMESGLVGSHGTINLMGNSDIFLAATQPGQPGSGTGQTFNFSGGSNTLDIPVMPSGSTFPGLIRGFGLSGDVLETHIAEGVANAPPSYDPTTGILTINGASGTAYHYDIGKGYSASDFQTNGTRITYTGPVPAACFLAGTFIRTPEGATAVEDLRVGDEVVVWADGRDEVRAVSWIGSATAVARPYLQADRSNYPVRILKDAIAEGVPYKDLLVTSDHFAAFNGCLLPVRTLVNGRSIFYDRSQPSYTYHHFEAGTHALVYADGMAMDTFLDAGHRRTFSSQTGVIPIGAPDLVADTVLPWNVHPFFVEPIYRAIAERARARGIAMREAPLALTDEPGLQLIADDGRLILPNRNADGLATFSLPGSIRLVRLVSRTSRRADTVGPFHDDRRFLGVHVGAIELIEGGVRRALEAHLTDPALTGWHEIEAEGRWTAGDALLPLGERHPHAIGLLSLRIISESLYVRDEPSVGAVRGCA
jgi:antigen 43